jgi:hypothetical protein
MKKFLCLIVVLSFFGCALPETSVRTGAARPKLAFMNTSADMVLLMDGITIGPVNRFDGNPGVLIVEEGVHQIEIIRDGKTVHSEKTFVSSSETRIISINSGVK